MATQGSGRPASELVQGGVGRAIRKVWPADQVCDDRFDDLLRQAEEALEKRKPRGEAH